MKLALLLIFFSINIHSQNNKRDKNLFDYFRSYSKAIVDEDLNSELDLMHPSLFQNYTKEEVLNDRQKVLLYFQQLKKKNTSVVLKNENYLLAIKETSKSYKKHNKEFRIINYILLKKVYFNSEFLNSEKTKDSLNNIKGQKIASSISNYIRDDWSIQTIFFDKEKSLAINSYHLKILAVRELDSEIWHFISNRWWNLNKKTKGLKRLKRVTHWKIFKTKYKPINISDIGFKIPKKVLKSLREKKGYNKI